MFSRLQYLVAALAATILADAPTDAFALESPWADLGKAQARLIAAGSTDAAAPVRAGIEIRLAEGWHTYWRYPGDAGVPPRFDWSGSKNVATIEVRWPAPERIPVEGLESIGYHGRIILPVRVKPRQAGQPVTLRLKLDIGVCEKICIPAEGRAALEIPANLPPSPSSLDAADLRVPAATPLGKVDKIGVVAARLERGKEPRAIVEVAVPTDKPFDLFAEGPTADWALPLPTRLDAANGRARFAIPIDGAPSAADPVPSRLRLTLVSGNRAVEVVAPLD